MINFLKEYLHKYILLHDQRQPGKKFISTIL